MTLVKPLPDEPLLSDTTDTMVCTAQSFSHTLHRCLPKWIEQRAWQGFSYQVKPGELLSSGLLCLDLICYQIVFTTLVFKN